MLKKVEALIVWAQLCCCCFLVLCVIGASKLFPDGNAENPMIDFLLKNITIQTKVEDDKWSIKYPFNESRFDHYISWVKTIEKSIDNYCTSSFPGGGIINTLVSGYKDKVMHYHVTSIPSVDDNRNYVSKCVDNVVAFKGDLNSLGIPFFYVQTPSKAGIDYYNNRELVGEVMNIAERSYCMTSSLDNEGIDVINIGRDYYKDITFDVTGHWKPTDGLDCAIMIGSITNFM